MEFRSAQSLPQFYARGRATRVGSEQEMHVEPTCCKLNSVKQSNGTAADDCYSRVSKKVN